MNKFFVFILLLSSYNACFSMGNPKANILLGEYVDLCFCDCSVCHRGRENLFEAQQKLALKQTLLAEAVTQKASVIEAKAALLPD